MSVEQDYNSRCLTLQQLTSPATEPQAITSFARHLLSMEPRIRLYSVALELDDHRVYIPTKTHIYLPYGFPPVEHEIAHFVEMASPRRWTLPDWGMGADGKFCERASFSHLLAGAIRENKVRSIQKLMTPSVTDSVLSNIYWVASLEERLPTTSRFKSFRELAQYLGEVSQHTRQTWSLDRIEQAWKERITHLQNWMETDGTTTATD